ncbi:dTDP-4-amino-4,6-dideoxygalactose transaminase [Vibrio breoganii]|uniref:dTDP-4-amino-4,6-dideoxygalactose transaminase n=1 Tax=Vibrio breoganii TaxID=553239 RepID=UPI000C82EAF5|nr:dTDP-4-amino-4,6-dideoxygalactose transaminase [Vibrio breoganii]PMG83494.1 dTDP-4-amino-4,6-dideoxygalactose transaminase [Vibrio breoganii]
MIPFNKPAVTNDELGYIKDSIYRCKLSGDGPYGIKCQEWFDEYLSATTLLTPSCTHALEMAAILADVSEGDEVIMPSYTFVSTANAFALRGAKIVFVDIDRESLNIDCNVIEAAITSKTKAIVPVHYAGVSCDMDKLMSIAEKYDLIVIEDAAQAMGSTYEGKLLGTIGHIGCFSFHETKNYTSGGEGGLLILNNEDLIDRAKIIREKGTNRSKFFEGLVDKYTWVDIGSSYLPSDIQAAYLYGNLVNVDEIKSRRLKVWEMYDKAFSGYEEYFNKQSIPEFCEQNAHMYYLVTKSVEERQELIAFAKERAISLVFHYLPLHTSEYGKSITEFRGEDRNTTLISNTLVRLPIYYNISDEQVRSVISVVLEYYENKYSY